LGMWLKLEMGMVLILLLFSVLWRRTKEKQVIHDPNTMYVYFTNSELH